MLLPPTARLVTGARLGGACRPAWIAGCLALVLGGSARPDETAANAAPAAAAVALEEAPRSLPVSRFEADLEFDRLVTAGDYRAALPAGVRLLELTEQEFGAVSRELAGAYADVADAQHLAGEHRTATAAYLKSIDAYRLLDGPFSPLVIKPLTGLGDNYHAAGQYVEAVAMYGEARTVSRRNYGLLNLDQIALLDRMTQSLVSLNERSEADRIQLEALRIVRRQHSPESDAGLEAILKYAQWLRANSRYEEERDYYDRGLVAIRETYGANDPREVPALVGKASSYRAQRLCVKDGLGSLQRALELLLVQEGSAKLAVAEVLRDIGDWHTAFNDQNAASNFDCRDRKLDGSEYVQAWQLLEDVPNGEQLRDEWFNRAVYVYRYPFNNYGLTPDLSAPSGHVTVLLGIDQTGRTTNVQIIESKPRGLKDEAILRSVRLSRFRPQIVAGEIVPTESLALRFTFNYLTEFAPAEPPTDSVAAPAN